MTADGNEASEAAKPIEPWDVFTPRAPVGELMFVHRSDDRLGERLGSALSELGAQVVVFGDTGVGKTSLVQRIGATAVARIECSSDKTFKDLLQDAFGALGVVQELRFAETHEAGAEGEVESEVGSSLGFVAKLRARFTAKTRDARTVDYEVVQAGLVDTLVDAMQAADRHLLFFDNFENITSDAVRASITQLMVALSDRAADTGNIKVVIAGIAESAEDLIAKSPAASRRTVSIQANTMSDEETAEIIRRGMRLLELQIVEADIARIAHMSAGYPYVTHLIGLKAAEIAKAARTPDVTTEIVNQALRDASHDFIADFAPRYRRAVEQSGSVRPRQRILHAMAESDERALKFGEVIEAVSDVFGETPEYTYFNAAIGQLCSESHGGFLRSRSERGGNVYSFVNPLARAYVRMVGAQGLEFDPPAHS